MVLPTHTFQGGTKQEDIENAMPEPGGSVSGSQTSMDTLEPALRGYTSRVYSTPGNTSPSTKRDMFMVDLEGKYTAENMVWELGENEKRSGSGYHLIIMEPVIAAEGELTADIVGRHINTVLARLYSGPGSGPVPLAFRDYSFRTVGNWGLEKELLVATYISSRLPRIDVCWYLEDIGNVLTIWLYNRRLALNLSLEPPFASILALWSDVYSRRKIKM